MQSNRNTRGNEFVIQTPSVHVKERACVRVRECQHPPPQKKTDTDMHHRKTVSPLIITRYGTGLVVNRNQFCCVLVLFFQVRAGLEESRNRRPLEPAKTKIKQTINTNNGVVMNNSSSSSSSQN